MTEMALKLQKSKRFCAIKGDNVISSIGTPLQTLGAPNTPLWIVHSEIDLQQHCKYSQEDISYT